MSIRGILRPQATQRVRQSAILANAEQPMAAAIDGAGPLRRFFTIQFPSAVSPCAR